MDFKKFGHTLFTNERDKHSSFEGGAQAACQHMYESIKDENGEPAFSLIRIFRSCTNEELPPEQVSNQMNERWLALMGTYGYEHNWRDRLKSQGHRVLPTGAFETPMLSETFRQINLNVDAYIEGDSLVPNFLQETDEHYKYFYVPKASGSPYIDVQDEFVERYGIESVVGFGLVLISGAFYVCLSFSRIPISKQMALNYVQISPYLSTLLAAYETRGVLWQSRVNDS
ncbi:MAG: hypothetical protein AAFV93_14310 [Chloroflexota bacterium]